MRIHGPWHNSETGVRNHTRIQQGRYPLTTQFGKYRSVDYSDATVAIAAQHMPGFAVSDTGLRSAILIHPGHPPKPYLSSIGYLNLTHPLGDQSMEFLESRGRVIALLDSLTDFSPASFQPRVNTAIPHAAIIIVGEPT